MNTKLSKLILAAGVALTFAAQAAPSDFYSKLTPMGDQRFAGVHAGLTADEVRSAIGTPRTVGENSRVGETIWTYDFTDAWGDRSEFDVEFKDGVVTEMFAMRTQAD